MPEIAEVEFGRKCLEQTCAGRVMVEVWVDEDPIVLEGRSASELRSALLGAQVTGAGRHGKQMWIELDRRPWLGIHFGMTGGFRQRDDNPIVLDASPGQPDRAWPPRFCKLLLQMDDGGEIAFTNARRLGRLRLRKDPASEPPIAQLGYDPSKTLPSQEAFEVMLARRHRACIKGLLLDQRFAAGVGNWIADEVLYQSRIDPRRKVGSLSLEERNTIRLKLKLIVDTAIAADARKEQFPKTWLFHHRWGKNQDAQLEGQSIEFLTLGGRTTAWVPSRQA